MPVGLLAALLAFAAAAVVALGYFVATSSRRNRKMLGRVRIDMPEQGLYYEIEVGLVTSPSRAAKVTLRTTHRRRTRWSRSSGFRACSMTQAQAQALGRHFMGAAAAATRDTT